VLYQVLRVIEQRWLQKVSVMLWSYPNAIAKSSVSVIINLRCGDSVCLCSMDFVSGSNIEILNNAVYSRNRFNGHCMRQVARSTCTSSLSLFRYIWVLIALHNCMVAHISFYGGAVMLQYEHIYNYVIRL